MFCPRCGSETPELVTRCENCGLALLETQADIDRKGPYRVGDVVAERYEVGERIATGPLFWAYLAFDQEEERSVCLRVIRQTILPRSRDHEDFLERIAPTVGVTLAGAPRVLRLERDEGKTLVVSEFVDGLSLRALIDLRRQEDRAFSAGETLAVVSCVAEALEAAGKVSAHGDLRPSQVTILDESLVLEAYGLASALPVEETIRALKDDPEAVGYLAPEVLGGRTGDPRSDVYAFAVMTGELLTGRVPPALGVGMEEFLQHLPPLSEEVLRRGLAVNLEERTSSPCEIVEALSAVLGAETWRKPSKRHVAPPEKMLFSKDPSVPAEPDADGTIPMISPFEHQDYRPPPPDGLAPLGADETQKNAASDVARAVATLEDEEGDQSSDSSKDGVDGLPRDPRISVQPAAEGTVQITADMIEPDSQLIALVGQARAKQTTVEMVESTPAVSMQPVAENTLQITDDMVESVDEEVSTDPKSVQPSSQPDDSLDEDAVRGDGLDPRLVRAAKHLDRQRTGHKVTKRRKKRPLADVAPSRTPIPLRPSASSPPPGQTTTPPASGAESHSRSSTAHDDAVRGSADEENIATTVQRSTPKAPEGIADAAPEPLPEIMLVPKLRPAARRATAEPLVAKRPPRVDREPVVDEPVESAREGSPPETAEPPLALLKASIGPIDVKVAGANDLLERSHDTLRSPDEALELPAVMVDKALTEAFGPSEPPTEPTHRVNRPDAVRPLPQATKRPKRSSKPAIRWTHWLIFIALLTVMLTLLGLGSLWLLD